MTWSTTEQTAKLHLSYETHIMSRIIIALGWTIKNKELWATMVLWDLGFWCFSYFKTLTYSAMICVI